MQAIKTGWIVGLVGMTALLGCSGSIEHEHPPGDAGSGGSNYWGDAGSGVTAGAGNVGGTFGGAGGGFSDAGTGGSIFYGTGGSLPVGGSAGSTSGQGGFGGLGFNVCNYPTSAASTPVTFVYTSNTPVYLSQGCGDDFTIYACDPATPLAHQLGCGQLDCATASANACGGECGVCAYSATLVSPTSSGQSAWDGQIYEQQTLPSTGCSCSIAHPAPSGLYTVQATTYLSAEDAQLRRNGYVHTQTFEYPPPNGVVTIFVGFNPL